MADLTDLEATRLCAEAIGFEWDNTSAKQYDPLHDREQCFELVEKLGLTIGHDYRIPQRTWNVFADDRNRDVNSTDLKRAIVHCAARIQLSRERGGKGT